VKGNQPGLHKAIHACFRQLDTESQGMVSHAVESRETHHGRQEFRKVTSLDAVAYLPDKPL
jgi:hypothetical protein